jgi:hypothetical protein
MFSLLVHVDNHGGKMNKLANLVGAGGLILATMSSAQARPIYTTADFSGGISTLTSLGSTVGLQRTNTCGGCAPGSVSGNVLFDKNLIPYNGMPFELSMQGGVWSVRGSKNKSYADLAASGYLNGGNNGVTNQALFSPVQQPLDITTVAEPATTALIVLGGIWGLIMARRRESLRAQLESTERSQTKEDFGFDADLFYV